MIEPIITKGITYSLSEHLTWIACRMLLHAPLQIRYRYARNTLKTSQASPASVLANAHIGSPQKPVPIMGQNFQFLHNSINMRYKAEVLF